MRQEPLTSQIITDCLKAMQLDEVVSDLEVLSGK